MTHHEGECRKARYAVRRATGCTRAKAAEAIAAVGPNWVAGVEWVRRNP